MDEAVAVILLRKKPDLSWRSYSYCAVDVETTGLDLHTDEVISVGAVTIIEGRFKGVGNFYEEITPSKGPSHSSIQVHGLRGVDLATAKSAEIVIPSINNLMIMSLSNLKHSCIT